MNTERHAMEEGTFTHASVVATSFLMNKTLNLLFFFFLASFNFF